MADPSRSLAAEAVRKPAADVLAGIGEEKRRPFGLDLVEVFEELSVDRESVDSLVVKTNFSMEREAGRRFVGQDQLGLSGDEVDRVVK